eukprot:jgi/Hompol1/2978/HPOL_006269-RA
MSEEEPQGLAETGGDETYEADAFEDESAAMTTLTGRDAAQSMPAVLARQDAADFDLLLPADLRGPNEQLAAHGFLREPSASSQVGMDPDSLNMDTDMDATVDVAAAASATNGLEGRASCHDSGSSNTKAAIADQDAQDEADLETVEQWLHSKGLSSLVDVFEREELLDWDVVKDITMPSLQTLHLPLGATIKFMRALKERFGDAASTTQAAGNVSVVAASQSAKEIESLVTRLVNAKIGGVSRNPSSNLGHAV